VFQILITHLFILVDWVHILISIVDISRLTFD